MKFNFTLKNYSAASIFAILLLTLPGCSLLEWFPCKSKCSHTTEQHGAHLTGEAIVTMDGKTIITNDSFQKEKADLIASNPQVKMMLAQMGENQKEFDKTLVDGLTNQAIVEKNIKDLKLDQTKEYQDELALMIKSIKYMFNNKVFSNHLKDRISESEIKDFYEKNKAAIPGLILSQGGIKAKGVEFDSEEAAKNFLKKVQSTDNDIQRAAASQKLENKVKDFKTVHEQSIGLDQGLKSKIVGTSNTPSSFMHKVNDKSFWVVSASSKEETTYQPFDNKIKDQLSQYLLAQVIEKELAALKTQYKVVVRDDFAASQEGTNNESEEETVEAFENIGE